MFCCFRESTKVVIPIEEVQYFHGQNILEFCHPNDQDRLRQHHDAGTRMSVENVENTMLDDFVVDNC